MSEKIKKYGLREHFEDDGKFISAEMRPISFGKFYKIEDVVNRLKSEIVEI